MVLNKQKGNMYAFVTHTWNPIKGKCSHECLYCYMKISKQKPIRLVDKELEDDLGEGKFIFIGSSTDIFADDVPGDWISKILCQCRGFNNRYLFQTKNPKRFDEFKHEFPDNSVFGTTLESNINHNNISVAPTIVNRAKALAEFDAPTKTITIEPILEFDIISFEFILKTIKPEWISIGADSKRHNLPEPSKEKIIELIKRMELFTNVKIKDNLKRLIGEE